MGKRGKSPPKKWQTDTRRNRRQSFSKIYSNMLTSPAWCDLTGAQKALYIACRDQEMRPHPRVTDTPADDQLFNMNRALYVGRYKLYKSNNLKGFFRDMRELVRHGFISVYRSGKNTRQKSIYSYSDKWKDWTKESGCKLTGADMSFLAIDINQ